MKNSVWVPRYEFWLYLYYHSQWPKTTLNKSLWVVEPPNNIFDNYLGDLTYHLRLVPLKMIFDLEFCDLNFKLWPRPLSLTLISVYYWQLTMTMDLWPLPSIPSFKCSRLYSCMKYLRNWGGLLSKFRLLGNLCRSKKVRLPILIPMSINKALWSFSFWKSDFYRSVLVHINYRSNMSWLYWGIEAW